MRLVLLARANFLDRLDTVAVSIRIDRLDIYQLFFTRLLDLLLDIVLFLDELLLLLAIGRLRDRWTRNDLFSIL